MGKISSTHLFTSHWMKNTWMNSFLCVFDFSDNRLLNLPCVSKSSYAAVKMFTTNVYFRRKNFLPTHTFFLLKRSFWMKRRVLDKGTLISHVYLRRSLVIFFPKNCGPFFSFLPIVSWYNSFSCSVLCLKVPTQD